MTDDSFMAGESAEELFEQAPCGYLAAQPNGAIVRVNETFLRMTGLAREAVLAGMKFQQFLTVPGQIYYDTHVAPLLQMQGFVREIAFDLKTNSGSGVMPVVFNCVQKNSLAGRALLLRITLFDASDRRKYERELLIARRIADEATQTERLAREEAERANRTKDDFLALVSHELRTPLSAILGWVQVLRRKLTDADLERGLSVIERNTRLQTRLVDDLLDLSRMASGKMRLDVQRVNLANVIEAAFETTTPSANARQVRLQKILDPAILVSGDPGRLQQVFWNLLSNAVKFTPKDGFARVVMERVNSHIEVSVVDSGQGMSADFLEHAFERFRQSGPARTGETGGLGLGLALVKYLVEMHGGSIVARSEGEGRGSTFLVKLPLAVVEQSEGADRVHPRSAVAHAERRERAVSLAGLKVLLVDDERDAREALWHNLSHRGAEVTAAGSVREALESIERLSPDVLISDIGMPDEDGYELIRQVRLLGERGRIPAIALTAYSRLEDRTRALMAGYQAHLAKPVDVDELAVTVASVVGRLGANPVP